MSANPEKVLRDAMKLPPEARAALAGSLLESIDQIVDEDAESEWEREIAKRIRELESKQVRLVPWSEARRAIGGA